jgi:uncharacterized coiled-coil DUF342 family protein
MKTKKDRMEKMLQNREFDNLIVKLNEKDRELTTEIQLVTAWIKEHRENRPACIESISASPGERNEYRSWRRISSRLHQRRSELKTKQEKIRGHLQTVARNIENMETGVLVFPVFHDVSLESDLVSVDACA